MNVVFFFELKNDVFSKPCFEKKSSMKTSSLALPHIHISRTCSLSRYWTQRSDLRSNGKFMAEMCVFFSMENPWKHVEKSSHFDDFHVFLHLLMFFYVSLYFDSTEIRKMSAFYKALM